MAGLCSFNLSIGFDGDIPKDGKQLMHEYGRIFENLYVYKNERNCVFKPEEITGKNLTKYIFNMFKDEDLDFASVPKIPYEDYTAYNLEFSRPISSVKHRVGQFLTTPEKSKKFDLSSFLIDNINLLVIILIGYLLTVSSILIISKITKRRLNLYRLLALNECEFVSPKFTFLFLSFGLFLFFNLKLLTNLIKTEYVVINTDPFIDSIDKLKETVKMLIHDRHDKEIFMTEASNKFLFQLYERKSENNEIFEYSYTDIKMNFIKMMEKKGDECFLINHELGFLMLLAVFSKHNLDKEKIAFMSPVSYYDLFWVIYIRKNLDSKKKEIINDRINLSIEQGFYQELFHRMKDYFRSHLRNGFKIYKDLHAIADDHSLVKNLNFNNFETIFAFFFGFNTLIFVVFLIHHLINFLLGKKKKFFFFFERFRCFCSLIWLKWTSKISSMILKRST